MRYVIDNILFDGSIDWLERRGIPTTDNFTKYIYSIDMIDDDSFYGLDNYLFHISVFTPDDSALIDTFRVMLPYNVDFMILTDTWDSGKEAFFYDPYQDTTVHRFYNMDRFLCGGPVFYTFERGGHSYILEDKYRWSKKGRYFLANIDLDKNTPVESISGDTILTFALDALTYCVISECRMNEISSLKNWK